MELNPQIIETDTVDDEVDDAGEGVVETRAWEIHEALHGLRLDRALAELVPEFSRSYLQQLIETGAVSISGRVATKVSQKVKAGERGSVELRPTPQSQAFVAEAMALEVLYEDAHLLVLNKPAGLVVHPAPGNWRGTLLNGLLARDTVAAQLPRAGIVHRLDKDTSGLMLVARSRIAMDALVRKIAAREVRREYLALAHGAWVGTSPREVREPIGRDPRNRLRMAVVDLSRHSGKTAHTTLRLIRNAADGSGCWLHCALHTGRTHQIRVHASTHGHPLVGDALYGGAAAAGLQRQALHAWRLTFRHPVSDEPMTFVAPPPQDFLEGLRRWGLGYNGPQDVAIADVRAEGQP